jgi:hypothetical protein
VCGISGLQVWFVVYKRAVALSLTAPSTSLAGIRTPVGTEVKGGDGSEPSAGSEPAKGGGRPLTE